MTFSPPFRKVFANPFPVSAGAAVIPWWLSGGIAAANCIAAYQPKGAASLAASYTNLANPGTYNAAPGTAPTWDATNGWKGNETVYLKTGIIPNALNWSMIARFSGLTSAIETYFIGGGTGPYLAMAAATGADRQYWNFMQKKIVGGAVTSGIMAVAGLATYLNGVAGASIAPAQTAAYAELYLLALNINPAAYGVFDGYMQAAAIYNITITAPQVAALTTAMNLL